MRSYSAKIYSIDLEPLPSEVGACRLLLNAEEAQFARRFESQVERNRWVVSRGMLRSILAHECKTTVDEIMFNIDTGKTKRSLVGPTEHQGVHFSIAKSNDLALLAVSRAAPLGIDIEYMRALQNPETVASYFMTASELKKYGKLPDKVKTEAVYATLTRKEAILKASGEVVDNPFASIEVSVDPIETARILAIDKNYPADSSWQLIHIGLFTKFIGALVVCTRNPITVKYISQEQSHEHLI